MNNREIKFRAWDKINQAMLNWEGISREDIGRILKGDIDYLTPSEFTGLLDKNGKEIYEGDIVKHENGIKEVKWENLGWGFDSNSFVCDCEGGFNPSEDCEIIGNIFSNPELLNNDSK